LRKKFSGKPEHVVNYFFFVAEEARQIMAQLGIRSYDELIGRADLLDQSKAIAHWKAKGLDFARIFYQPSKTAGGLDSAVKHLEAQDHGLEKALDHRLIAQARGAINNGEKVSFIMPIKNLNRTVGAMLSGEVVQKYGHAGLADDTIHIQLQGTAGQSAGAFLAHGVTLDLVGSGNDYVGKGLSGGRIIIRPNTEFRGRAVDNIICGNTVLYGAIAGEAFINGVAGERFAVRNSGAIAVVEGTGDHGCEYMTAGTVIVLGDTGRNFAAGMSGGIAYVYDPEGEFAAKCNLSMVSLEPVLAGDVQTSSIDQSEWHSRVMGGERETDEAILRSLIERHFKHTGSTRARNLLDDWARSRAQFIKVFPTDYKRALIEMAAAKMSANKPEKVAA
jgi:glutamate synthase (NADPH/NADH) large chain